MAMRLGLSLRDADAVLAYLRDPSIATHLRIDPKRIAIAGHSMGGWVVAHTAAHDHALTGAILISMADMGLIGGRPRAQAVAAMGGGIAAPAAGTAAGMGDWLAARSRSFVLAA